MPQYYFHVALRGDLFEDRDGRYYADLEHAKAYGRRLALDLRTTGNFVTAVVLVVDALGQEVARVRVDNVVAFPRGRPAADRGSDVRKAGSDRVRAEVPGSGE